MRDLHQCQEERSYKRMPPPPPPPGGGEGEVRLYVKSKKSVRKFKTPFRSTKRLSPLAILHNHGPKDIDVDRIITWGGGRGWMPLYLRMTVCEYVMHLK